ncbi:MAG: biotin--[Bacteroidaceae bacterium]|nr:biotin--[acetyl-CoA-carboxylase] ligase [Bacteroidaceae bacterium]
MLDNSPDFLMIELDEVSSTNTFLRDYRPTSHTPITLVTAEHQTAGRGQTGNTWESERSSNLLFSLQVKPASLPANHTFALSQAIALAIREAIASILNRQSSITNPQSSISVKWPNDIYVGDRKIAGILIENDFRGASVERSIIGCGVNINQADFKFPTILPPKANAPTPVSLLQITGQPTERSLVLSAIVEAFRRRYPAIESGSSEAIGALRADYLAALYRRTGFHPYRDANGTFMAEIADVEPSGCLILRDSEGRLRHYAFKQVAYLPE